MNRGFSTNFGRRLVAAVGRPPHSRPLTSLTHWLFAQSCGSRRTPTGVAAVGRPPHFCRPTRVPYFPGLSGS